VFGFAVKFCVTVLCMCNWRSKKFTFYENSQIDDTRLGLNFYQHFFDGHTGKNPTYAQAKISFSRTTRCTVWKLLFAVFAVYERSWKIKNITMVDFNNKILKLLWIHRSIQVVEITVGWCGWKWCHWLSFLYDIAFNRVTQQWWLLILINCDCLDRNGLYLPQYLISKHRGWLIAFFGWN